MVAEPAEPGNARPGAPGSDATLAECARPGTERPSSSSRHCDPSSESARLECCRAAPLLAIGRREVCAQRLSSLMQAQNDLVNALAAERLTIWATRAAETDAEQRIQNGGHGFCRAMAIFSHARCNGSALRDNHVRLRCGILRSEISDLGGDGTLAGLRKQSADRKAPFAGTARNGRPKTASNVERTGCRRNELVGRFKGARATGGNRRRNRCKQDQATTRPIHSDREFYSVSRNN